MLDAVALSFILAALAGTLGMYQSAVSTRNAAAMRAAAVHIAETQCSYLEEQAYSGTIGTGSIEWLGTPEDLMQNGTPLNVQTYVTPIEAPMKQVNIQVSWTLRGKEESFRLERRLRENV